MSTDLECEIHAIGAEIAEAFPSAARHPMKALDAHALELASSDRELRTALFGFVDVVPACRSLDELASTPSTRAPHHRLRCRRIRRIQWQTRALLLLRHPS